MSFLGSLSEARGNIHEVEVSNDVGHSKGGASSPILNGASGPGGAASGTTPAGETQIVGRLRKGIKTPRTRTDSLTRLYAATPR